MAPSAGNRSLQILITVVPTEATTVCFPFSLLTWSYLKRMCSFVQQCWKVVTHSSGRNVSLYNVAGGTEVNAMDWEETRRVWWWCFDSMNLKGQGKPQASALLVRLMLLLLHHLVSLLSQTKWGKSDFCCVILSLCLFKFHVRGFSSTVEQRCLDVFQFCLWAKLGWKRSLKKKNNAKAPPSFSLPPVEKEKVHFWVSL